MAISFNAKECNLFNNMRRVVTIYDEDSDHVIRRRFNRLHFYNLYQKHRRLVELDEQVAALQRDCRATDTNPERASSTENLDMLFSDIDERLKDFDAASMRYQRSLEAPAVPKHFLERLQIVTQNNKDGRDFHRHYNIEAGWNECALYTATEKGIVHQRLDRYINTNRFIQRIFCKDAANQDTVMLQYQERTVRLTEDIFINLTFCTLLVVPIVLLMYVPNSSWRLVVVALFIFLSTFLSSFMATATHKPGLAIVAGYAAILVVFLSGSSA